MIGKPILEMIKDIIAQHSFTIAWYAFITTFTIILMATSRVKRKNKYRIWKKDVLNFGIFKREWEADTDVLLQELFDENQRLEDEAQVFKKKYIRSSMRSIIVIFIMLFTNKLQDKFKRKIKK